MSRLGDVSLVMARPCGIEITALPTSRDSRSSVRGGAWRRIFEYLNRIFWRLSHSTSSLVQTEQRGSFSSHLRRLSLHCVHPERVRRMPDSCMFVAMSWRGLTECSESDSCTRLQTCLSRKQLSSTVSNNTRPRPRLVVGSVRNRHLPK